MPGSTPASPLWIRRYAPSPDAPVRLACLPHAGGSASFFLPVARTLAPAVDVLAVQYPGRQDRYTERCIEDLHELADEAASALEPWTDAPLALLGHSMGASLAFEVALRLERKTGAVPVALFASGRRAPSRHREETVHLRDDDGIIAELKRLNGTDSDVLGDEELLRMVLPAIRGDYTAAETYRPRPGEASVSCPVVAMTGDSDPKVSIDEARAWEEHTTGGFDLHVFPGGHFYLADRQAEVLKLVADRLNTTP
ncbi:thioesterase II family protein [Nocardiopsis potens]|uniref:thioesterase II family protein n=1 Tax=Nocardiopsis potens TaxID=1246458 RepID=UPI000348E9C5|nr:alpha/beta fold hydrolase [Nocardiopsis potens]